MRDAVVHPAGAPELAHAGIDDGVAGLPLLPALELIRLSLPAETVEVGIEVRGAEIRMVIKQVPREFPPCHFLEEFFGIVTGNALRLPDGLPDLKGRDLAMGEVRRQARGRGAGRDGRDPRQ